MDLVVANSNFSANVVPKQQEYYWNLTKRKMLGISLLSSRVW